MARHGFGIVGCGMIAEYHARAIAELPDARLVAVLDTSAGQDKGQRIAGLATGPCAIEHELKQPDGVVQHATRDALHALGLPDNQPPHSKRANLPWWR